MRSGTSARSTSRTAEYVALVRQLGGFDPYAHHFVPRDMRALGRALTRLDPGGGRTDRFTLGLNNALRARHRWLDGLLVEALGDTAEQVVLLGSGFDARPWRFAEVIDGRPVYLVDHPATAAARAERGPGEEPNVQRVDVRFDEEDFAERLSEVGFAWDRPAVFIWEGVTMYLPRPVVESTLSRIAHRAAPGTRVGFDLVAARPPAEMSRRERWARAVMARMSEPVVLGLPVERMRGFVEASGLAVRQIVPVREARGGAHAWPDLCFVDAVVP